MDFDIHLNRPTANLHDILTDPTIPEWKKDLIVRKRNTNRILFGNLKLTCAPLGSICNHNTPTADAIRNDDITTAATATDANLTEEAELEQSEAADAEQNLSEQEAVENCIQLPPVPAEEQPAKERLQEEVEDFHPQEDSPQVNGASAAAGVGTDLADEDGAVDCCLSVSAAERVSPECRAWCEGAMRLNNDTDRFPAASKILLNVNPKSASNKAVVTLTNNKRPVLASSNKIMGEERPKMKSSVRKLSAPPLGSKPVVHTVNLGDPEEIKYGPGIVHKLRDRYINITLRETASANKQRPPLSNLRRASSLDNILDDPPAVRRPPPTAEKKQQPPVKAKTLSVAENIKRHRSMETLLFEKQAPLVNDDIVIIEHSQPLDTSPGKKTTTEEDDLPPPDVVKQTRQKFERRTHSLPQPSKQQGIVASRVATFKKPALQPKPANLEGLRRPEAPTQPAAPDLGKLLSPVEKKQPPVIISEEPKVATAADPKVAPAADPKVSPKPKVAPVELQPPSPPVVTKESPVKSPEAKTPPVKVPSPKESSLKVSAPKETPVKVVSPKESPVKETNETPLATVRVAKEVSPPPPRVLSPKQEKNVDDEVDDETSKIISKKALENIRKNGFSMVISPKGSPNLSHLPSGDKATSPQVISLHQKVQDKQVGVIRPITKVDSRVSEKNLINAVKSEQPLIKAVNLRPTKVDAAPSPPPTVVTKEPSADLWGNKKRPFNEQPSTQCFDFTTRKSVPDYIENDGLGQRPPPIGDEMDGGAVLTFAINFEIIGGNVLINGRSSLQKQPKASKMRIKFDDGATSMFEYPSEASLLLDDGASPLSSHPTDDGGVASQPRGLQSLPSGTGSLASYTPSKMSEDTFELGVTRAAAMTPVLQPPSQPQEDSFLLKPADDEDTVAWSSESASSDLLF
ncbi:Hypothetical predicted protein [Cloeon dipterum]|uniref:Uncharacterized protein n=1 Tax=Cloeon dipterum TaxID=197152 RepID=A0A8S1CHB6_9INSE|nr:Hypothetical predicted protein [Cloeon dipterum]